MGRCGAHGPRPRSWAVRRRLPLRCPSACLHPYVLGLAAPVPVRSAPNILGRPGCWAPTRGDGQGWRGVSILRGIGAPLLTMRSACSPPHPLSPAPPAPPAAGAAALPIASVHNRLRAGRFCRCPAPALPAMDGPIVRKTKIVPPDHPHVQASRTRGAGRAVLTSPGCAGGPGPPRPRPGHVRLAPQRPGGLRERVQHGRAVPLRGHEAYVSPGPGVLTRQAAARAMPAPNCASPAYLW